MYRLLLNEREAEKTQREEDLRLAREHEKGAGKKVNTPAPDKIDRKKLLQRQALLSMRQHRYDNNYTVIKTSF